MINEEIATIFERVGQALEFRGKDRFRALAYERGARSLRGLEGDLSSIAAKGTLEDIPGIGHDLSQMIDEYIQTHHIRRCERELRLVPNELLMLMDIPGLGPKTVALLHKKHHVKNLADLIRLLDTEALLKVRGFGEQKIANLKRGIALWQASKQRMLLGTALPGAELLLEDIRRIKGVKRADVAGSLRRRRETIGDLDFLIISPASARALREFSQLPVVKQIIALGDTRATVIIEGGIQVDVRAVPARSYGAALQYFTGSKDHNVHLRSIAQKRGLKINEYGVFRGRKRLGGASESECYRLIGMPVMPAELREDRGEIEAALEHRLPVLIEKEDLRGDLHIHTDYSDGRSSLREMVEGAASLDCEYVALTDHSPAARVAHGLSPERLEEKIEELDRVRQERGRHKPRLLLGAEVDILANGKLDYTDNVLAKLDVVVASIHAGFRQSRDRMTGRLLDAISNPKVQILGHPTTRLIGGREAINFDFDRILQAVIDADVAFEIDSQPDRLDLTDTLVKAANDAGALFAINSDAHSISQLEYIRYGVFVARRGWVEASSVINTWTWRKLVDWLRKRRSYDSGGASLSA